ncbi:MAG: helix-turn-helix domain-containing protein [Lachnospiraceae bacterium]|nr:helix-turn-helix domain-containing protein [Lachnospiraceae bacterium]
MKREYTLEANQLLGISEKLVVQPFLQEDTAGHDHNFFELVYITGGTSVHTLNDQTSLLSKGDYFIVDYGSVHQYSNSQDFSLINCMFLPEVIDSSLNGCRSFDALMRACLIRYYSPSLHQTSANRIFHDENGQVLALLTGMREESLQKKAGYPEVLRCRLLEILIITMRSLVTPGESHPKNTAVLDAIQYADSHYHTQASLSAFCEEHHYSLPYISRRFRQETGMTFTDYLQKLRIEKSCELLAGSDMRIAEIAQAVGYEDIKFFNRLFKRTLGMPPREYRRVSP